MDIVLGSVHTLVFVAGLTLAPQQPPSQPQTPARPAESSPVEWDEVDLPVSVDKIQKALSRPPAIKTPTDRPVFRVEVFARRPTIEDILGPDYLRGPVPYGGMTHQEFLNMVTPVDYRGYSMFTNKEGLTLAATSMALQWAVLKAVDKLRDARDERALEAARQEVLAAMNELEAARKKAGLPSR